MKPFLDSRPVGGVSTSFVRVAESVNLPQGSLCDIRTTTRRPFGQILVEGLSSENRGIQVAPTLTNSAGDMYIRIANLSDREVTLKAGVRIGLASEINSVRTDLQVQMDQEGVKVTRKEQDCSSTDCKIDLSHFPGTTGQKERLESLVQEYKDIFYTGGPLGTTDTIKHPISLKDETPICQPYRRVPPHLLQELKKHLEEQMEKGIIRESTSNYASPKVLVRKKNGKMRLCVDFRQLNQRIRRDAYPLPRIEESLQAMGGSRYFSTLDLVAAYNQIEVEKGDQHKTAFTTPFGLFEYSRMPFGLSTSPATFQRLMGRVFHQDVYNILLVYLDDVIIFSGTIDQHIERLAVAFSRLRAHKLKLEFSKCSLFQEKVRFLGHVISADGIKTDPNKVSAVKEWVLPRTVKDLRRFLGFVAYYRRFVPKFAALAAPLHKLVASHNQKGKSTIITDLWTDLHTQSFQKIKDALTTTATLGFPDFTRTFILETDASHDVLGAVLSQVQAEGTPRIIAFASRSLRDTERNMENYSSMKLELLALKWAVVDKFREYLLGSKFIIRTDNNPLTYLMSKSILQAVEQRWASSLAGFDFKIEYKPGHSNQGADALSRQHERPWDKASSVPLELQERIWDEIPDEVPTARCNNLNATCLPSLQPESIQKLQKQDSNIMRILELMEQGRPTSTKQETKEVQILVKQWQRLRIDNGVLIRVVNDPALGHCKQVVLPKSLRPEVLKACHDMHGHQGIERTLTIIRPRCYWPGVDADVRAYIARCERCLLAKELKTRTPMGTLSATRRLEVLAIDFTLLEKSNDGRENVLIMTDVFTKFTIAVATRDELATAVARVLVQEWFYRFGAPMRLHSDQGKS